MQKKTAGQKGEGMNQTYEILAPIVVWLSLTAIALIPPLGMHIGELEARLARREAKMQVYEKFVINCLSGRNLLVDKTDAVMCIKI